MKYSALLVVQFFWFISAYSCPINPSYQIATNPTKYSEKSNTVFFGRLCNIDNLKDGTQIAEFQVIDIFKGDLKQKVRIINKIETDCSKAFRNAGTNYFVFGNLENTGKEIIMNGFPSFVSELYANELDMLTKLHIAKSYKSHTADKSTCLMSVFDN